MKPASFMKDNNKSVTRAPQIFQYPQKLVSEISISSSDQHQIVFSSSPVVSSHNDDEIAVFAPLQRKAITVQQQIQLTKENGINQLQIAVENDESDKLLTTSNIGGGVMTPDEKKRLQDKQSGTKQLNAYLTEQNLHKGEVPQLRRVFLKAKAHNDPMLNSSDGVILPDTFFSILNDQQYQQILTLHNQNRFFVTLSDTRTFFNQNMSLLHRNHVNAQPTHLEQQKFLNSPESFDQSSCEIRKKGQQVIAHIYKIASTQVNIHDKTTQIMDDDTLYLPKWILELLKIRQDDPICLTFDLTFTLQLTKKCFDKERMEYYHNGIYPAVEKIGLFFLRSEKIPKKQVNKSSVQYSKQSLLKRVKELMNMYSLLSVGQEVHLPIGTHLFYFTVKSLLDIEQPSSPENIYFNDMHHLATIEIQNQETFFQANLLNSSSVLKQQRTQSKALQTPGEGDKEAHQQLLGLDLNEIVRKRGLLDLDLIEKVLEAKKREAIIVQRRDQLRQIAIQKQQKKKTGGFSESSWTMYGSSPGQSDSNSPHNEKQMIIRKQTQDPRFQQPGQQYKQRFSILGSGADSDVSNISPQDISPLELPTSTFKKLMIQQQEPVTTPPSPPVEQKESFQSSHSTGKFEKVEELELDLESSNKQEEAKQGGSSVSSDSNFQHYTIDQGEIKLREQQQQHQQKTNHSEQSRSFHQRPKSNSSQNVLLGCSPSYMQIQHPTDTPVFTQKHALDFSHHHPQFIDQPELVDPLFQESSIPVHNIVEFKQSSKSINRRDHILVRTDGNSGEDVKIQFVEASPRVESKGEQLMLLDNTVTNKYFKNPQLKEKKSTQQYRIKERDTMLLHNNGLQFSEFGETAVLPSELSGGMISPTILNPVIESNKHHFQTGKSAKQLAAGGGKRRESNSISQWRDDSSNYGGGLENTFKNQFSKRAQPSKIVPINSCRQSLNTTSGGNNNQQKNTSATVKKQQQQQNFTQSVAVVTQRKRSVIRQELKFGGGEQQTQRAVTPKLQGVRPNSTLLSSRRPSTTCMEKRVQRQKVLKQLREVHQKDLELLKEQLDSMAQITRTIRKNSPKQPPVPGKMSAKLHHYNTLTNHLRTQTHSKLTQPLNTDPPLELDLLPKHLQLLEHQVRDLQPIECMPQFNTQPYFHKRGISQQHPLINIVKQKPLLDKPGSSYKVDKEIAPLSDTRSVGYSEQTNTFDRRSRDTTSRKIHSQERELKYVKNRGKNKGGGKQQPRGAIIIPHHKELQSSQGQLPNNSPTPQGLYPHHSGMFISETSGGQLSKGGGAAGSTIVLLTNTDHKRQLNHAEDMHHWMTNEHQHINNVSIYETHNESPNTQILRKSADLSPQNISQQVDKPPTEFDLTMNEHKRNRHIDQIPSRQLESNDLKQWLNRIDEAGSCSGDLLSGHQDLNVISSKQLLMHPNNKPQTSQCNKRGKAKSTNKQQEWKLIQVKHVQPAASTNSMGNNTTNNMHPIQIELDNDYYYQDIVNAQKRKIHSSSHANATTHHNSGIYTRVTTPNNNNQIISNNSPPPHQQQLSYTNSHYMSGCGTNIPQQMMMLYRREKGLRTLCHTPNLESDNSRKKRAKQQQQQQSVISGDTQTTTYMGRQQINIIHNNEENIFNDRFASGIGGRARYGGSSTLKQNRVMM